MALVKLWLFIITKFSLWSAWILITKYLKQKNNNNNAASFLFQNKKLRLYLKCLLLMYADYFLHFIN